MREKMDSIEKRAFVWHFFIPPAAAFFFAETDADLIITAEEPYWSEGAGGGMAVSLSLENHKSVQYVL